MRILAAISILVASAAGAPLALAEDAAIGRLGHDVVPVSESISLDADPRQPDYDGVVEIVVDVKKPVRSFRFHAEAIELRSLTLTAPGNSAKLFRLTATPAPDTQVVAAAPSEIPKGRYTLRIEFHKVFDVDAKGLYRLKAGGEWYAFTQFEAVDARKAFPCWDEPEYKIPYRITLTVPKELAAIANTPEESATEQDGKRTVAFRTTRPLPAYLLAVAIGPFEFVPIPGTSIPSRVVTPKGQAPLAAEAVKMTPPILASLERYFGGRYPYEKMDLIAVPEYWYGAMENPGAITYVDRVLLLDPKTMNDDDRQRLAVDTAHEIAHMWFGDLVTMLWWDDLWLNESFASWMEDEVTNEVFPEFNTPVDQVRSAQGVMEIDSLLTTRAMRQPVKSMDSLLQSADALAYAKGAAVLHMTEGWLGKDVLREGVLIYLKEHADGSATGDDLWNALGKVANKDVKSVLSSFLDQPGVPLVSAVPLPGGRVKLSQSRFVSAGAKPAKSQLWRIPVTLRYPEGAETSTQRFLLTKAEQVMSLGTKTTPAWIHPNSEELGYYRWSVPSEAFERLTAEAGRALDTRERVGFLGNAAALLSAGKLKGDDYVKMLEAFAADPDAEVVGGVLGGLEKIRETFFAEGRDAAFAPFVRRTLLPSLERFGAARRPGEAAAVTELRPKLLEMLGDAGQDGDVLAQMERLATSYLADAASIDPALADAAIKVSAIRGDAARFDLYRERFEAAQVPAVRKRFLAALGNFRDPALVARALEYVFKGPLRPQETMSIPRSHGAIPSERGKTYEWMTAHYDEIAARIPPDFMVFMPYFAAGCSEERVGAAKTFFAEPKHSPPGTSSELARVVESVGDCVDLDAREGESVRRYITSSR